jgi:hypothetical protein
MCAYGMPRQIFLVLIYLLSQLATVCEGRGTCFRISTELRYIAESEWDWKVRRLFENEFLINIPSTVVLKLL